MIFGQFKIIKLSYFQSYILHIWCSTTSFQSYTEYIFLPSQPLEIGIAGNEWPNNRRRSKIHWQATLCSQAPTKRPKAKDILFGMHFTYVYENIYLEYFIERRKYSLILISA